MTISKNKVPVVRIGVLQSTEKVKFSCNQNFFAENQNGEIIFTGRADEKYQATIVESKPAEIRYQVRAGIEKDKSLAEERAQELRDEGLVVTIRCVGMELQTKNLLIDNREYWIAVGDFADKKSAQEFRQSRENPGEYAVIENIVSQATATIELAGQKFAAPIRIVPENPTRDTHITVSDIVIGIEFHWQKLEDLDYRGIVEIGVNNSGKLVVVNEVNIEDYLTSVNSSEMTSDCPLGLLEAQTVAARSTVFATMGKHHYNANFHLCSDDHCQCYHGKKREQDISRQAVENTWGEVIMYENEVCDARYSKICGGIIESYHNVWENRKIPYMMSAIDSDKPLEFPANTEEEAKKLIDSEPDCYCNTNLYQLPPKLANLYSTENLFRWTVEYKREDLENLIKKKTGEDIGELQDIEPLERGDSGRLIYLNLVGSKKTLKIGKELEIRRVLSESHLYSSLFYVEKETAADGKVKKFILKGGGWGHGVGLCQVGATVMAMKNIPYPDILKHYYQQIRLEKLY
ncbi:MAG: SpoIID/LytB domain-containing protein [Calditrichaeota bacterium]|nr:SpoIID/LytB domain-containing protein [Calditrichota bacterium]